MNFKIFLIFLAVAVSALARPQISFDINEFLKDSMTQGYQGNVGTKDNKQKTSQTHSESVSSQININSTGTNSQYTEFTDGGFAKQFNQNSKSFVLNNMINGGNSTQVNVGGTGVHVNNYVEGGSGTQYNFGTDGGDQFNNFLNGGFGQQFNQGSSGVVQHNKFGPQGIVQQVNQ